MNSATRDRTSRQRKGTQLEGLVVRTEAGFHRVLVGDRIVVCRAPKKLMMGERTSTTAVVIGDHVRITDMGDGTGVIDEVLPRETELVRGMAGGGRFVDVIAANLDELVAVHSIREPDFNGARLDRFLLIAEAAEIPAAIILNKADLAEPEEIDEIASRYRRIGYPVICTSAKTGAGIDEVRSTVTGKVSALVGPSGVGKSSLLNDLQPGLRLRTGEISESTGKGRHTTTTAELLPLSGGGWLADTPGLRELAIRDVEPEDLAWLFPEFREWSPKCRFSDCAHREEIGCAVWSAVERGDIDPERYRSYRNVYEDLEAQKAY